MSENELMVCHNCHCQIPNGSRFCPNCGCVIQINNLNSIKNEEINVVNNSQDTNTFSNNTNPVFVFNQEQKNNHSDIGKTIAIGVGCLLLGVIIGSMVMLDVGKSENNSSNEGELTTQASQNNISSSTNSNDKTNESSSTKQTTGNDNSSIDTNISNTENDTSLDTENESLTDIGEDVIHVTKDNLYPVIINNKDITLSIADLYKEASYYTIQFQEENNNSANEVYVTIRDAYVGKYQLTTYGGTGGEVAPGKIGFCTRSISWEEIQKYDSNAETMELTIEAFYQNTRTGYTDTTYSQDIVVDVDVFEG